MESNRREVLRALGTVAVAPGLATFRGAAGGAMSLAPGQELAEPLVFSSARALAAAIARRELSSVDVVEAYLERIARVNPALNAVFQVQHESARAAARRADEDLARGRSHGPLHGVPMTIKDSLDTAGVISTAGTLGRREFVPGTDATVVRRLREAGAILLGKTNTPEFTAYFETFNLVYGTTNNPWDPKRTPGGSSGGAAALVAAGGTPFDIGSDFGGSIRLPAHYCGVCGLKPTAGRVPRTGHNPSFGGIQDIFQQLGPLARTVDDLDLLFRLITGPDGIDPAILPMPLGETAAVDVGSLRVTFHVDNGVATPTQETQRLVREASAAVAETGAQVHEELPAGVTESFAIGQELWQHGSSEGTRRELERWGTVEHTLGDLDAEGISMTALEALLERWWALRSRMLQEFARMDVILCPANAAPAALHDTVRGWDTEPLFSYTETYNITGWPAAVVPCGLSPEGLPIGVQVVAAPGREDRVLAVAAVIERALGGYRRPPEPGT